MRKRTCLILRGLLLLVLALTLFGCSTQFDLSDESSIPQGAAFSTAAIYTTEPGVVIEMPTDTPDRAMPTNAPSPCPISEDGVYDGKDDVALYLHLYSHLPANYITKKEAKALGWNSGKLDKYAPGKCIGGDYFGNYEGLLPGGVTYHECDIGTLGAKSRGSKRIVYGDNGAIYYTDDHYASFTELYGGN